MCVIWIFSPIIELFTEILLAFSKNLAADRPKEHCQRKDLEDLSGNYPLHSNVRWLPHPHVHQLGAGPRREFDVGMS